MPRPANLPKVAARRLLPFLAGPVAGLTLVLAPSPAFSACTPNAPASGDTVVCTGTDTTGVNGAAGVNNVTVQLDNTADVSVAGTAITIRGSGWSVENTGGSIAGSDYGIMSTAAAGAVIVTNSGTISTTINYAINLGQGGSVTNTGTITGATQGFVTFNAAGSLDNSGTITASSIAVHYTAGGTITNQFGATISSPDRGVILDGGSAATNLLTNNGTISGTATFGAYLAVGGTVNNNATGTITGAIGLQIAGGPATVTNDGIVTGTGGTGVLVNGTSGASFTNNGTVNGGLTMSDGDDTITLSAGSSLSGAIDGRGGADGLSLIAGSAASGTLSSNLSNVETLTVNAPGSTWVFTGTGTLSGGTNVTAGTLRVNGTLGGAVIVASGATLGGSGTVGPTTVNGTLAPGNSIGTITVNGNLSFAPGGAYAVELSPAAADRTNVIGSAAVAGTVQVAAGPGSYAPGAVYTIVNATGGVTGAFTGLVSNFSSPFLTLALDQDPNNVYLTIVRNGTTFTSVGETPNQIATGTAVDSLGGGAVADALASGTASQARAGLDLLSGEVHATSVSVMLDESRYVRDAVNNRLRQSFGSDSHPLAGAAALAMAYAEQSTGGSGAPRVLKGWPSGAQASQGQAFTSWVQAIGAWGHANGDGNAAALNRTVGGFVSGVDATFDRRWRIGVAGGYTRTSLHVDDRASSATIDNTHVAVYAGGRVGGLGLRAGAAHTWHGIDSGRSIAFNGFSDSVGAHHAARTAQVFGEAGYLFSLQRVALEPFAAIAYVNLHADGFAETGGAAALVGDSHTYETTFTSLGVRTATVVELPNAATATLRGTLGWRHAFGDVDPAVTMAFAQGGTPFAIAGPPIARDSLMVDGGIDFRLARNATFGIGYSGLLARDAQDHAGNANLTVRF